MILVTNCLNQVHSNLSIVCVNYCYLNTDSVPTAKYSGTCCARAYTANPYTELLIGDGCNLETFLWVILIFPRFVDVSVFEKSEEGRLKH